MQATITSKGQITIPKKLRNHLHLNTGDKVEFVLDKKQQSASIMPLHQSAALLKNILPKPKKTVTLEDMDDAIKSKPGL